MTVELVEAKELKPADWRATYMLKPDLRLLQKSIADYGWLSNLVVNKNGTIIDGYARWGLAGSNRTLLRKFGGFVPVVSVDVDEIDARIMHVRLNRAVGQLIPRFLSLLVKDVLRSGKYSEDELKKSLGMGIDEFTLLLNGGLFRSRNIEEHQFSMSWEPVESSKPSQPVIERPPTADR